LFSYGDLFPVQSMANVNQKGVMQILHRNQPMFPLGASANLGEIHLGQRQWIFREICPNEVVENALVSMHSGEGMLLHLL
jgi:hypothetical protein